MTNENIPIFKVVVDETINQGIEMISLVEQPAIESNFILLNKNNIVLSKVDEYKMILTGASLIPDRPILRVDDEGNYFYILYDEDNIRKAVNKFFKNGLTTNINLQHNSAPIDGNYLIESWFIEDFETDKAKSLGFEKLPKGTWMTSIKISDEQFWKQEVLSGNVKGFSIEMNGGLMKFNSINKVITLLDYSIKSYESNYKVRVLEDTNVVMYVDSSSNEVTNVVPDGDYETTNNEMLIVEDGKLVEIISVKEYEAMLSYIELMEEAHIELAVPNAGRINNIMDKKTVVKIYYQGSYDGNETINAGFRSIEIFTYGLTLRANRAIRAWQREGSSDSGIKAGWKLFLLNKITSIDNTIQTYSGIRPDYNPNDSGMTTIFRSI